MVGSLYPAVLESEILKIRNRIEDVRRLREKGFRDFASAMRLDDPIQLQKEIDARYEFLQTHPFSDPKWDIVNNDLFLIRERKEIVESKPIHEALIKDFDCGDADFAGISVAGAVIESVDHYAADDLDEIVVIKLKDGREWQLKAISYRGGLGGIGNRVVNNRSVSQGREPESVPGDGNKDVPCEDNGL